MEELKKDIEKMNGKFERLEDKFNMLMDTISKSVEKQNENKECCEMLPKQRKDELILKTYDIVKRMNFETERRIWEERAKKIDDEIEKLRREKECIGVELRDIENRYYREY